LPLRVKAMWVKFEGHFFMENRDECVKNSDLDDRDSKTFEVQKCLSIAHKMLRNFNGIDTFRLRKSPLIERFMIWAGTLPGSRNRRQPDRQALTP
jgi:hypothetical protein